MGNNKEENTSENVRKDARPGNVLISTINWPTTRREFLKVAGLGSAGVLGATLLGCTTTAGQTTTTPDPTTSIPVKPMTFVTNAKMMVIQEPSKCVGCRRCEVACTAFHDNKIQPNISRVKISRNFNFGPEGPRLGMDRGPGLYGNFRLIGETCLQCPHPVPCMTACPSSAIVTDPTTGARVIDLNKCTGCGICTKACPWQMTSLDEEAKKATKCDLCGGDPECVKTCPSGALSYVPWRDRTKDTPFRQVVPAYISAPAAVAATCVECHPGTVAPK
jgi:Fe-S-cluster-containing dehydrogenase component